MGEILALSAALFFGLTHFFSGLLSRRADGTVVAFFAQAGGSVFILLCVPFFPAAQVDAASILWGTASGVGTGVGVAFLYRAMSMGKFSVVVPVSDVTAVALPVLAAVVVFGDRPPALAWGGIALALPALWLTSRTTPDTPGVEAGFAAGTTYALIAGVGFALQFVALAQAHPSAGLWPILASRISSVAVIGALLIGTLSALKIPPKITAPAAGAGVLGTFALVLYSFAAQQQLLSLAVVLTALYPAIPVLLGLIVLRERLSALQVTGLVLTAAAISLITLG
ncbi:EamA family transporter [Nocardioides sp. NPDC059952]|uniref:EamA family transporter n=1 Tax=Nocardioides sp. NPDC059952 TaxID=3347014 RepID=UPI00365EDC78